MTNLLFLIPSLGYGGAARQLTLLAATLPRDSFRIRVCVLGLQSPWVETLRQAGVPVDVLGWTRPFDARPFLTLRLLVREFRPDVIHAWGQTALRALALTGSRLPGRVLVSAASGPGVFSTPFDRWLLRRAGGVLALGPADAGRYRRAGVHESRITVVAPAVLSPLPGEEEPQAGDGLSGLPAGGRVVLGIGPIEPHKGFHGAVWALDILRYLYGDLHLVLVGDGSDRPRVEAFARTRPGVHFLGHRPSLGPLLRRAEVVWVPSLRGGGVCAALEAMAAGRPVIASRCPDLAEVVAEGQTGYLIEPNDRPALARQTRALLEDPARRRRFGQAGRQRVAGHFTPAGLADSAARLYTK